MYVLRVSGKPADVERGSEGKDSRRRGRQCGLRDGCQCISSSTAALAAATAATGNVARLNRPAAGTYHESMCLTTRRRQSLIPPSDGQSPAPRATPRRGSPKATRTNASLDATSPPASPSYHVPDRPLSPPPAFAGTVLRWTRPRSSMKKGQAGCIQWMPKARSSSKPKTILKQKRATHGRASVITCNKDYHLVLARKKWGSWSLPWIL